MCAEVGRQDTKRREQPAAMGTKAGYHAGSLNALKQWAHSLSPLSSLTPGPTPTLTPYQVPPRLPGEASELGNLLLAFIPFLLQQAHQ